MARIGNPSSPLYALPQPMTFKSGMIAVGFSFEVGSISDYSNLTRTLDLRRLTIYGSSDQVISAMTPLPSARLETLLLTSDSRTAVGFYKELVLLNTAMPQSLIGYAVVSVEQQT